MHNEPENSTEDSGPVGGERLRVARRESDISVRDVAKELHLDELKVRALEKNDFDVLGAPVFAKGHLRKYAELVGVSTDDIMSDYYQMNRAVGAPPVVGPKRKSPSDFAPGPWMVGFVVLAVAGAAGYWWYNRDALPEQLPTDIAPATLAPFSATDEEEAVAAAQQEGQEMNASTVSAAATSNSPPAERQSGEPDLDGRPQTPDSAAINEQTISEPVVVPDSGLPQVRIELIYSGDCWTEVSDGSGRRLYYDLGRTGSSITLTGDAPLRVILGDIGNVGIKVAGEDYTVPRSSLTGRLARLTLDSPR